MSRMVPVHIEAEWPRCGLWLILNDALFGVLKALHIITEEWSALDDG
jgi:hypothetical protein